MWEACANMEPAILSGNEVNYDEHKSNVFRNKNPQMLKEVIVITVLESIDSSPLLVRQGIP